MGAQVIVDEVRGGGGSMLLRTAEGIMNRVKKGMPGGWREMIESEAVRGGESVAEMYVGEGDACVKIEKELWLFGVNESMKGLNVNLCNYVLSHARYAVKIRRDVAHLERRTVDVWDVLKRILSKNIQMAYAYLDKDIFLESFVEGCTLVDVNDNGNLVYAYDGVG
ncbi:hypothetical protein NQZ68_012569 [Dissostichus eleginoides]|nr:hypothetical protein NQZ68_012569 [Dissostichus eleginoides]